MVIINWKNKNVFITGATGFLGSHLTKHLIDSGANVTALIRDTIPKSLLFDTSPSFANITPNLNIVHGNLEDTLIIQRSLNEYETEIVVHLGAQTIVTIANHNPLSTFESNIRGTYNVLEACRNNPLIKAVVIASSDKAYGSHPNLPYTEKTPLNGSHPYDVSKSCTDLIAQSYYTTYNVPVCITRCGNFYGPGDLNTNRLIPGTIRSILLNQPPTIRSDGTYIRDYLYIKDAALAYMHLVEKMYQFPISGEAFNFSTESQITVLELVNHILLLMDSPLTPKILSSTTNEIQHQYLSAKKAHNTLSWYPHYTLQEGLLETIDWYKNK